MKRLGIVSGLTIAFFLLISCVSTQPTEKGKQGSIGILFKRKYGGRFYIVGIMPKGPADKADLQKGDEIIKVDSQLIKGIESKDFVNIVKGDVGSSLDLEILRDGKKLFVSLKRENLNLDKYKVTHKSDIINKNIGYVKFTGFSTGLKIRSVKDIYSRIYEKKVKSLIIDFRDFPGFRDFKADLYLIKIYSKNKALGFNENLKTGERRELKIEAKPTPSISPLVILVNDNTAGGGEMITLALQEYGIAYVIGNNTAGFTHTYRAKGSNERTHKYISPKGTDIHGIGLKPDRIISSAEEDVAIQEAVEYLNSKMIK